jgi:CRP-like cAMP-binding protein
MAQPWVPGSFLDRLRPADRDALFTAGITRTLPPGHRLLTEGADDTHVEVLRRGFVKVTTIVAGRTQLLAVRVAGDVVGELAAVGGTPRTATVTTCGTVVSTVLRQPDFLAVLRARPEVADEVTASLGRRLQWANSRRAAFNLFAVPDRVAEVLADLAGMAGRDVGDGIEIGVDLTHLELAMLIGAGEDTVQKALRGLRDDGLIRTGYRRVTVLDVDRLRPAHYGGPS